VKEFTDIILFILIITLMSSVYKHSTQGLHFKMVTFFHSPNSK